MHEAIKHEDPCAKRLANVVRQVQVSWFGWIVKGEKKPFCLYIPLWEETRNLIAKGILFLYFHSLFSVSLKWIILNVIHPYVLIIY